MERIISVEDRIRKAEEIYAKRNNSSYGDIRTKVNDTSKKERKISKKLMIQAIICICIYGVFLYYKK